MACGVRCDERLIRAWILCRGRRRKVGFGNLVERWWKDDGVKGFEWWRGGDGDDGARAWGRREGLCGGDP